MVSQAQALAHRTKTADEYNEKFEILRKAIERSFADSVEGRDQAKQAIQSRVNELSIGVVELPTMVPALIRNCDSSDTIRSLIDAD